MKYLSITLRKAMNGIQISTESDEQTDEILTNATAETLHNHLVAIGNTFLSESSAQQDAPAQNQN